jgi:hypothetical protein
MSTCLAFVLPRLRCGYGVLLASTALLAAGCATTPELLGPDDSSFLEEQDAQSGKPRAPGRPKLPLGWPATASSDEQLLAPLLACSSTADFLALQRGVDMEGVVQRLSDWNAVRLGALGPLVEARASLALTAKRASFLLKASQDYGAFAQVFALFIIHTAFDDELAQLLRLLARDKQLSQTLGHMETVRLELERRGLDLGDFPDRAEKAQDVLRGLGHAATDALNTSAASDGGRYLRMTQQAKQLPPPYQDAIEQVERELMREHFSASNMALGSVDQLTFGVPLGFYHLVAGTAHGAQVLRQGQYEQATRELAPAALLAVLYAGGKGSRYLAESPVRQSAGRLPVLRLEALKLDAWQLAERLGEAR